MSGKSDDLDSSDSYAKSLDAARDDALFSFNEHIRVFEEEATKGGRIAQLDGLILTIFVSVLAASESSVISILNYAIVIGIILLFIGFILGMLGQFSMEVAVGVSEVGINGLLEEKSGEVEYKEWSLEHYKEWISDANSKGERRAKIVKWSAITSVVGLVLLLAGMLFSLLI